MRPLTPEQQFAQLLAADASRPFVTYYDESSGERSELSARSLGNWVAKTHHLIGDELGLGVGDTALVALPAHWISVPIVLGCLTAGLALTPDGSADVAFVADTATPVDALDVYAIAPTSAAVGLGDDVPEGVQDYVTAVRPQGDAWGGVLLSAGPDDPCLPNLTRAQVCAHAAARAGELGLGEGGRLLVTRDWSSPDDWLAAVLAPLAVGGSLVIVRNAPNDQTLARRAAQERTTATLT